MPLAFGLLDPEEPWCDRVGEAPALGVRVNVELDEPDALVELLAQRDVRELQRARALGIESGDGLDQRRRRPEMVAVVGTD